MPAHGYCDDLDSRLFRRLGASSGELLPAAAARQPPAMAAVAQLLDAPSNPARSLAAALRDSLALAATPTLLPGAAAGAWTVLFGSERDAAAALAAKTPQLFGRAVRLVPAGGGGQALRIFVSGDRSQVGKSTVCLGLLGALLARGMRAEDIAYIKPATQCEAPQLVGRFCAARGIACRPIGPIVYYSGFTRAFLAGETESSAEMLAAVQAACDELGQGRKVVVVDGVGYPAVGSITETSNAAVARALKAPVLLVGKKGVGDAVDSYVLNRAVFDLAGVPVLGSVFNRLEDDSSYYSLENCKAAVSSWFEQAAPDGQRAYGFLPQAPAMAAALAAAEAAAGSSGPRPSNAADATAAAAAAGRAAASAGLSVEEDAAVASWVSEFCRRVDVDALLADADSAASRGSWAGHDPAHGGGGGGGGEDEQMFTRFSDFVTEMETEEDAAAAAAASGGGVKRGRGAAAGSGSAKRSRAEIQQLALQTGAAASAGG
jgi:dethiobiotin synthetase